jgi:6,7-dimethyl-8-ribityllumazine synthase
MLRRIAKPKRRKVSGRFAIVAAQYNSRYVDALVQSAQSELKASGVKALEIVRVPGSFEIPAVASKLAAARRRPFAAILCLGVIFQGETSHAQHIGEAISHALARIQLDRQIPVIHGVFVFKTEAQARVRCLGKTHNRGLEAARTALEMARVMERLRREGAGK